ncbi:fumarate reductase subunit C, partial [Mycobacterium tuberculosis]
QPVERYWWARRRSYLRFMLREISCIFVAWFVLYLVLVLRAVAKRAEPVEVSRALLFELGVLLAVLAVLGAVARRFALSPIPGVVARRHRRGP